MNNKMVKTIGMFVGAFLLSAGLSFGVTTYLYTPGNGGPISPVETPPLGGRLNIDPNAPRDSECPINGQMYTSIEKDVWESRRPLYVMIENSVDARPQSGLGSADVVYEAVSEGGITRFGAVFYCGVAAADTIIAPVRSARTAFVDIASEYNFPLYVHVGGANCSSADGGRTCQTDKRVQALEQISSYGWNQENDLNQFSIGFPNFWRDEARLLDVIGREVATEHSMTTTTEKLWTYALDKRGWSNESPDGDKWAKGFDLWSFKDDAAEGDRGDSSPSFGFWEKYHDFDVKWSYDRASNTYTRENGGNRHYDLNDDSTYDAKVVVVQFVREVGPVDDLKHMFYEVIGSGDALIFQDGKATKATWKKTDRESRTVFTAGGKEVSFNRGPIWVEIIPTDNTVSY